MNDFMIGHNAPPPIEECVKQRLADEHSGLVEEAKKYAATIDRLPEVVSSEDAASKITTHVRQIKDIYRQAEAARKTEKDEYLRSGKAVDTFFKELKELLQPVERKAVELLTEYQIKQKQAEDKRRKEEQKRIEEEQRAKEQAQKEADEVAIEKFAPEIKKEEPKPAPAQIRTKGIYGGTTTLKEVKEVVISDISKLDLNKLKSFISEAEILKALRQYERVNGNVPEGAKIIIKQEAKVL